MKNFYNNQAIHNYFLYLQTQRKNSIPPLTTNDENTADQNTVKSLDGSTKPRILNSGNVDSTIEKSSTKTLKPYKVIKIKIVLKKMKGIPFVGNEIKSKIGSINKFKRATATHIK